MNQSTVAPDLSSEDLARLAEALLNAAIAERETGYVIFAINGSGNYVVSFNIDRPALKRILTTAASQIPDTPDAQAQS